MSPDLTAIAALPAGMLLGFGFFRLLAINSRMYTDGRVGPATGLHLLRIAVSVGVFVLAAMQGALVLLSLLGGFLLVRPFMLKRERRV